MNEINYKGPGVVMRHGELFLKGRNRYLFEQAFERNIRRALAHRDDVEVIRKHGRIFILGSSDTDLVDRLSRVFGASSLSPVVFCEKNLDAITAVALELAQKRPAHVKTFRISARRSDKSFAVGSSEMGRIVGAEVVQATGLGVNLSEYDLNIGIEIGVEWTFLWCGELRGAGGLPVGTGGKAMLLLSGGIDSPVAGHLMQKRGVELSATYFHAFPYTSDGAKDKVQRLAQLLAARQGALKLSIVSFTAYQEMLREHVEPKLLVVLYRRAMVRIAEGLAQQTGASCLVTGESLGQVASQTLPNIAAIEDAATRPILRPLIGFDKAETIVLAKKIGSYEISILPHDDCCSLFIPKHPETRASIRHIRKVESRLEWQPFVDECISNAEIIPSS